MLQQTTDFRRRIAKLLIKVSHTKHPFQRLSVRCHSIFTCKTDRFQFNFKARSKCGLCQLASSRLTGSYINDFGRDNSELISTCDQKRKMSSIPAHPTSICMKQYDAYGFDLDHTLAKYRLVELFNTIYTLLTDALVDQKGYDPALKNDLHKYKDFVCKGLFLDLENGNILKIADDGKLLRVSHGTRFLTVAEIQQIYGNNLIWEHFETVKKSIVNNPSLKFRFFENYFDCPALVAMARIIDIQEEQKLSGSTETRDYLKIWIDIRDILIQFFDYKNFGNGVSPFFARIQQNPASFVDKCSADIKQWLRSLKAGNKCVFLVTSSFSDFASLMLETILGPDWPSYFDISVFAAAKPSFFTGDHPFHTIENHTVKESTTDLQQNGFYFRGNEKELTKFIAQQTGKENPKVVYFGDNICSDCYPVKTYSKWETVLLLEEMDAEGYVCEDGTVVHEYDKTASREKRGIEHSSLVSHEEMEYLLSNEWGPFLCHKSKTDASGKLMNTFWGAVISEYSDITVPSLEYLAAVPLNHKFPSFGAKPGNTQGFHPGKPASLLI